MSNRGHSTGKSATGPRAVVKKGTQSISDSSKNATEKSVVPASTLRALQLRNGKGGSFGTGEIVKISGREKLELLAEDEMQKARDERRNLYEANMNSSIKAPFQLETAMRIAQSQMDAYIDLINALHNPDLCYDIVNREIECHCPPRRGSEDPDYMLSPSFVAEQFGVCTHNAHMLASGWVIIYESFRKLQELGLRDREVSAQLKSDDMIRNVYHSAYGLLKELVSALQQRLRSIVQNTPHYSPYFKSSNDTQGCHEFERSEIRRMYTSFLDSAIIELCFPGSKFSPQALYFCLNATQEENPRILRRCPQLMWDAVGDLAEAVRLMDLMETPLLSQDPSFKFDGDSTTFNEFVRWKEAQPISVKAALDYSSFVNMVFPLSNLKNKATLNKLWDRLNANYIRESGQGIDALWQLVDARYRISHFSTLTVPVDVLYGNSESGGKALVRHPRTHNGKRKAKSPDLDSDDDSTTSMPSLKAVSDSEDGYQEFDQTSDEGLSSDEYDEDEDQELKRQQREAIERALEDPDAIDLSNNTYAEERQRNPLLLLLGNLRGRLFPSTSVLRTDGETTATRPPKFPSTKKPPAKASVPSKKDDERLSTAVKEQQSMETIVEDADDESVKKKKKPKKKKKKKSTVETVESSITETPTSPILEPPKSPSPPLSPQSAAPPSPTIPKNDKKTRQRSASVKTPSLTSGVSGTTGLASTASLPLPPLEQKAESAHSYLRQRSESKSKVKTRPEQQPVDLPPDSGKKERRNLFDRLRGKDRDVVPNEDLDTESKQKPKDKGGENAADVFARLKKKTVKYARRLIGVKAQDKKGALKWDQFLQVMRELGFEYDPSTAGSSVRFDPPNPNDRSITFHKPHPDPTLYQYKLKEYRAKLEAYYGWSPEKFEKAVEGLGGMSDDEKDV
ncbi:uncharacterized protein FOMMEDRAFT_156484 [Fomitiporia mediterranea MF3/22]|uniref:uncharacterized protein n=1 Tax=Fomitiporia mediterranea (strain MF3/22) TaxID=694068 RepID=UPI00044087B1|nr:uncharacterized protein FOMMEDRAFT_156484 [Fomitiporia mediterranea MF3/22]EJD03112.1 hypothetical protein FOMMEDRAFT_156484 [Fomitiporia mediterranea MF3/22]